MTFGEIKLLGKYDGFEAKFNKALSYIVENDLSHMVKGDAIDLGDDIIIKAQEYTTAPADQCLFEAHRHHFDIHYILQGEERFGVTPFDNLVPKGDYYENFDAQLYNVPENYSSVILREGDYIIVSPDEPHQPKCVVIEPCPVKKLAVKIKV